VRGMKVLVMFVAGTEVMSAEHWIGARLHVTAEAVIQGLLSSTILRKT
jgi:hypothetical protein